jgi:hypothetical protein
MADRFVNDPDRLNHTVSQSGKEYNLRLIQRTQSIFKNLLDLLPSSYISTIEGPNYSVEIKAVSLELARLELALEDVKFDIDFHTTRTNFLYTLIGYMVFMNDQLPSTDYDDEQFRQFLLNVIGIYFQGSIPEALLEGVQLFFTGATSLTENFLLARFSASGFDISDEFGFQIDVTDTTDGFPDDVFTLQANVRLILDIIRPAHTLFRIRYIFTDHYNPNEGLGILDVSRSSLASYYYEDFRVYSHGLLDQDRMGRKVNQLVIGEDHTPITS